MSVSSYCQVFLGFEVTKEDFIGTSGIKPAFTALQDFLRWDSDYESPSDELSDMIGDSGLFMSTMSAGDNPRLILGKTLADMMSYHQEWSQTSLEALAATQTSVENLRNLLGMEERPICIFVRMYWA